MPDLAASDIFSLAGETVLVTGASGGLGRRFGHLLAANGARVCLAGRRVDALNDIAAAITRSGGEAVAVPFDATNRDAIPEAFDRVEAAFGPVTVLVNNAGIAGKGSIDDLGFERWREILSVDLDTVFTLSKEATGRMPSRGGAIINVSSIHGLRPNAGRGAYAVAKSGVIQLSGVMALEFASRNIRVNVLAPGYVVTPMNQAFFATPQSTSVTDRIPLGRVGQVDDLDGAMLFLASGASRYVTGATVVVDGGHVHTF